MAKIHLGKGLTVDAAELASQVVAALGMRGSGKSNVMAVIAEALLAADIQVLILDYVGIWFSLRLDDSGKKPSPYQIPVLGGRHGDIGLQPTAGTVVAQALARSGSSAVLDVSAFSKTRRQAFATDFAEALFEAKKEHAGPTFLILEEAQRFIPQRLQPGQERMLGAFEEIAEVGRNYGLGLGLLSQRPQKLNKEVLNLTELLFAFQANGVLERKAIAEWVQEKDADGRSEVKDELPSLHQGEALVWSPSWLRFYSKMSLPKKSTYDAGKTPLAKRAAVKTKPLDLATLEQDMTAVVAEAKANDPAALKAEVARLRAELAKAGQGKSPPAPRPAPVISPLTPDIRKGIVEIKRGLDKQTKDARSMVLDANGIADHLELFSIQMNNLFEALSASPSRAPQLSATAEPVVDASYTIRAPMPLGPGERIRPGEARILSALQARHPERLQREQLAVLACMSPGGGTYATYTGSLVGKGLIEREAGPGIGLTAAGLKVITRAPSDRRALVDEWKARKELGGKKKDILEAVATGHEVSVDDLCERFDMTATGGTWATYSGTLVGLGVVTRGNRSLIINPELAL